MRQCKHGIRAEEVIRATKEFQEMTASPRPQLEVVPPTEDDYARLQKLREPFPENQIDKLPKGGTMLDYVGHAGVTNRLLEVDPLWDWQPLAMDEHGLPLFSRNTAGAPVGLWIKLTVCGVTRLGYGSVAPNAFDAEKQLIGDAIRNAAMRFGVALDLWAKSDLHDTREQQERRQERPAQRPTAPEAPAPITDVERMPDAQWKALRAALPKSGLRRADVEAVLGGWGPDAMASWLDANPDKHFGHLLSDDAGAK